MSDELLGRAVTLTGADRFVGRHVAAMLERAGARVRALTGPSSKAHHGTAIDLRRPEEAEAALAGSEIVVHLAAHAGGIEFQQGHGTDIFDENFKMTRNVLAAAAAVGADRVFLASSAVVYAKDAGGDLAETAHVVAPSREYVTPYAWSKLTDEAVSFWFRSSGIEVVVGRFTNVFGPGAPYDAAGSTVIHALVKKAIDAGSGGLLEVWGDGSAIRSFIHVRDVAAAVRQILVHGEDGEVYNVSAIGPVSIAQLADIIRELVDPTLRIRFDPSAPTGVPRRVLDFSKVRSIGFEPRIELRAGIEDVINDYTARS